MTPVYKKGGCSCPNNYRPITLTSVVGKILESIIRDHVFDHLISHNLLSPQQHGFVPGKSCVSQLITAMDRWTQAYDSGYNTDIIYFDFSKAFDTVPHLRLLHKLEVYGIKDKLLMWFKNFLVGRQQCVVLNNIQSSWSIVTSGVPQGSVLGPLLFTIFVNDIPHIVRSDIYLFADDIKLSRTIKNSDDIQILQDDIYKLFEWSVTWNLNFSQSKCCYIQVGPPSRSCHHSYMLNSTVITLTDKQKDLGIWIDPNLSFHSHTHITVSRANRILGLISKCFRYRDSTMMLSLYKTIVRPIVEYGNVIWGPHFALDQQSIEKIQRRTTKLISTLHHVPYTDRLALLRLPSLQYRRWRGDMILMYRIIQELIGIDQSIFSFRSRDTFPTTRGHQYKIFKHPVHYNVRANFFTCRIANVWNDLPSEIIEAPSLNYFKSLLDNYWNNIMYNVN